MLFTGTFLPRVPGLHLMCKGHSVLLFARSFCNGFGCPQFLPTFATMQQCPKSYRGNLSCNHDTPPPPPVYHKKMKIFSLSQKNNAGILPHLLKHLFDFIFPILTYNVPLISVFPFIFLFLPFSRTPAPFRVPFLYFVL